MSRRSDTAGQPWVTKLTVAVAASERKRLMKGKGCAGRRLADPKTFAHIQCELGIDPADHQTAIGCAETRSPE
jgi:hypothetical protein